MWLDLLRELVFLFVVILQKIPALNRRFAISERIRGPWAVGHLKGRLWLHGASMGECGVLLQIARSLPLTSILMTTQKKETRDWLLQKVPANVLVQIAPLDHPSVLKRFLASGNPKALVLCENEIWPGWITACALRKIPVAMVSAVMTEKGFTRWNRWGQSEIRIALRHVEPLWVQGLEDAQRFMHFGKKNVSIGGDWKWLSVPSDPQVLQVDTHNEWDLRNVDLSLVSMHQEDWPSIGDGLLTMAEFGCAVVLIPRYLNQVAWFQKKLEAQKIPVCLWPKTEYGAVSLVTQYGLVRSVLEKSRLALLGGSFCNVGVHNYREALACGVPALIGPKGMPQEEELGILEKMEVIRRIQNLEELCIGRNGRDVWVSTWFPWETRYRIPEAIQVRKSLAEAAFGEFLAWTNRRN